MLFELYAILKICKMIPLGKVMDVNQITPKCVPIFLEISFKTITFGKLNNWILN